MSNLFKISLLVVICSIFDNYEPGLDQIRTSMSIKSIVYVQAKKKNKTKKKRKKEERGEDKREEKRSRDEEVPFQVGGGMPAVV